ncbi:hypothetical protein HD554DRAFT_1137384 [Boletus coccyginus]|nr:hypothetical protein HD554DRAFT_1137384 [Boletus coccyginus]
MEYYIDVLYPSLLPLSEKPAAKSITQAVLSGTHTPENWAHLVRQVDPNQDYIVTALSQFKEHLIFSTNTSCCTFSLENPPQPPLLSQLSGFHVPFKLPTIHSLPDSAFWAPQMIRSLFLATPTMFGSMMNVLHISPGYPMKRQIWNASQLLLFGDSALTSLNGVENIQRPPFFTRRSHFLHFIPVGTRRANFTEPI